MTLKEKIERALPLIGVSVFYATLFGGCGGCVASFIDYRFAKERKIVQEGVITDASDVYGVCRYGVDVSVSGTFEEFDSEGNVITSKNGTFHWYNRAHDLVQNWQIVSRSNHYKNLSLGDSVHIEGVRQYFPIGLFEDSDEKFGLAMDVFCKNGHERNFKRSDNRNTLYEIMKVTRIPREDIEKVLQEKNLGGNQ